MKSAFLEYRSFFFFNDTATTEIYTLSLHDALPIYGAGSDHAERGQRRRANGLLALLGDRKSTRLNSSHLVISYAVFCLKKKISDLRSLESQIYTTNLPRGASIRNTQI